MFTKINLFLGVLAFTLVFGASAFDQGAKATAMQNIENRPSVAPQVTQSAGPVLAQFDRGTKATAMQNIETRQSVTPVSAAPAEMAAIRTQRAGAADVSSQRSAVTESRATVEYSAPSRSGAQKPSYYATHGQ